MKAISIYWSPVHIGAPKGYWTLAGYRSDGRKVLRWVHL